MINKITFEIETITPMFLAGAEQGKAELRAASIKGLLRFWWRALQAESELDELRKRESRIFGSADEKKGGGSTFSIRIAYNGDLKKTTSDLPKHNSATSKSRGKTFPVNILEYLAYGPCTYNKNKRKREYIQNDFRFSIYMTIFKEIFAPEILKAMYVFDLFGGMGSKSRNGFGSFSIANKEECFNLISSDIAVKTPYTKENLQKFIKRTNSKTYTSFAEGTKNFSAKESFVTWDKALFEVGKIYRDARLSLEPRHDFKKRQYIGAPLNPYQENFSSILDRHSKPYFIKIAKEGNKYRAYILYLPSRYCIEIDNAVQHDRKFTEVCNEFNSFLAQNMDTVI